MPRIRGAAALLLSGALPYVAAETAILQLRVLEGEGVIHAAGGRTARPLVLQVADELGRPVEGAAVSFRLPVEGASGSFSNGLRTNVAHSGPDGRVSPGPIHWDDASGPVRIRITAAKDQARAGAAVSLYLNERKPPVDPARGKNSVQSRLPSERASARKWWMIVAAAGATGAALLLARPSPRAGAPGGTVQIGAPTITIGRFP